MGKQTASMKERIKNYYGVDIIRDVVREWGEQYWLQLDPDEKESQPIVSLVILYPNKVQVTHNHFGFHEILIGISGTCYHWCGERKIVLTKGKIGHVDNDCTHRIINPEATPAHFISVIYPDVNKTLVESDYLDQMKFSSMAKKFNLDKVIVNFADLVHMKCFLLDQDGSLYGNQEDLPALCKRCRKKKLGNCLLFDYGQQKLAVEEGTFQCCFGVTVNQLPVTVNHATLGYLLCGFGRISDLPDEAVLQHMDKNSEADYDALPLISPNHLIAIAKNLSLLTNTFVDLITTNQKDEELNTYKRDLTRERETQVQLEELLNQTQIKFLESQINVHFLFNTLNTIAQQAYIEGATNVASLTYALSNLLRLSLGKEKAEITIQEELNYIHEKVGMARHIVLLNRLITSEMEDVVEEPLEEDYLKMNGVAIRVGGKIAAIWIVIGVLSDIAAPEQEIPENIQKTTTKQYYNSLDFLTYISKQYFATKLDELLAQEAFAKNREIQEQIKTEYSVQRS